MANDPSACVHLGYYKDGVPVYGLCEDKQENLMTSCYSLLDGQQTEDVTCADGNTYAVAGNESSYEFDSSSSGCNLDKANGGFFSYFTDSHLNLSVEGAIHPTTGHYSYFMTSGYPWVPIYYYGQGGASALCAL